MATYQNLTLLPSDLQEPAKDSSRDQKRPKWQPMFRIVAARP